MSDLSGARKLMLAAATAIALGSSALPASAGADNLGRTRFRDDHGVVMILGSGHMGGGGYFGDGFVRVAGGSFPGRDIGNDFAGFGLGQMRRGLTDGRFPRDHLHHYGNVGAPLSYYDGFSNGDDCSLVDRDFRYQPDVCE